MWKPDSVQSSANSMSNMKNSLWHYEAFAFTDPAANKQQWVLSIVGGHGSVMHNLKAKNASNEKRPHRLSMVALEASSETHHFYLYFDYKLNVREGCLLSLILTLLVC